MTEPIAIVGMGCRLPAGIDSPDELWEFLMASGEATGPVPAGRWEPYEARYGPVLRQATRQGSFISDAAGFDADFFGVTPREAEMMDPQQRIMLEVTWQALEDAGIPPSGLAGTDVGVFAGVGSDDYGRQMLEDLPNIEAWTGIGAGMCAVANRVSYMLDLRGPSLAVDTACSSSLVAIHLACNSLAAGESTLAIAGGVHLIAGPGLTMVLDAAGAISPDGRSKSFDATADGYGRGEGCGLLILKRLADAERDGDRVLAVIRGSAVNQDGRTNGIMAPSGEAQEHVVRRALDRAGVRPDTVDYVEAHGTGTRMGDPLEAGALGAVYGRPGTARPCLIGSVKSNIGHLEAGAGVAGVIKAVMSLRHGELPPTVNFTTPNPAIEWERCGLEVVKEAHPWPTDRMSRRAAVSSFGYGGTVAHLVLEQATEQARTEDRETAPPVPIYALSGASPKAVRANAERLAHWLAGDGRRHDLADVAHTLLTRRTHLPYRAAVVTEDRSELETRLGELTEEDVVRAKTIPPQDPVWVFSGHGSQWSGMGRELLAAEPVFAEVIDDIGEVFAEEIGFTPRDVLQSGHLGGVDRVQPMIFAMQLGLAGLWRSYGVRPAAVIGHSVGEIAAAVTAGVLDRHDGARLICRRSKLLRRVAGKGAMAMVSLPFAEVSEQLNGRADVVPAIWPSPNSTVISGEVAGVQELSDRWKAEGAVVKPVASDVAFHSPQMDELLDALAAAAEDLPPAEPVLPFYSTALDDPRARPRHDGGYWAANLRNPVRLADAVSAAVEDGHRVFLEISAHPVVAHSIGETFDDAAVRDGTVATTLRRDKPERETFLGSLADLHCQGGQVRWEARAAGELAPLPLIAWQHRPFWYVPSAMTSASVQGHDVDTHTLLGRPIAVAGAPSLRVWETYLDQDTRPYPGSHPVHGVEIMPAAVLFTTFLEATGADALTDISLRTPVFVTQPQQIQVVHQDGVVRLASRTLAGEGREGAGASWVTHTTAAVGTGGASAGGRFDLEGALSRHRDRRDPGSVLARLHEIGVADTGFHWKVERLVAGQGGVLATVTTDNSTWASLFDAILTVVPLVFPGEPQLRMPSYLRQLAVSGEPPARALVEVRLRGDDVVDVTVADRAGRTVARMAGLRFALLGGDPGSPNDPARLLHRLEWERIEVEKASQAQRPVTLVGGTADLADRLLRHFQDSGIDVTRTLDPAEVTTTGAADVIILPENIGDANIAENALQQTWRLARTAQLLVEANAGSRLWTVTTDVREVADESALAQGPLWGLGRIIAGEHPEVWGGMVDLDRGPSDSDLDILASVVSTRPAEDVVSVRSGQVQACRLMPVTDEPSRPPLTCHPDGTYVITGGLGVLGLEIAGWLAGRGARHLVLVGRTGLPPRDSWDDATDPAVRRRTDGVRALEALGVSVRVLALDIADPEQARQLRDNEALNLPPVRGVVHAAGVLDNRLLHDLDEQSLRTVMRPKAEGAMALHETFPPGTLDFLVFFSSNGLLLGLTGQAGYASGNAFLDALARHRRADTVSLGWTSWRGMGMAANDAVDQELRDHGVGDITPAEAFQAWEAAARLDEPYLAVMPTTPIEAGARVRPILRLLEFERADGGEVNAADLLAGLDAEQARERLVDEVAAQVSAEIKLPAADLDIRRPLPELGLDSVMTVGIRRRLEKRLRIDIPTTLLWTHPTVTEVAAYLAEQLAEAEKELQPQ
ncbi:type I polyketide synthase [Actinomadura rudentiformis]|uniref:Type I polyketide synthase n=1 Tax=Actinomadura rudentiformis TaxID=359158 RepID=A0A6H9YZS2_9ACTN|nr:type I polyketide synthase [Actinomadura rudentiformis]KAB2346959.1 type I polyketide synthase [Actinomadura rudentiformis]